MYPNYMCKYSLYKGKQLPNISTAYLWLTKATYQAAGGT